MKFLLSLFFRLSAIVSEIAEQTPQFDLSDYARVVPNYLAWHVWIVIMEVSNIAVRRVRELRRAGSWVWLKSGQVPGKNGFFLSTFF